MAVKKRGFGIIESMVSLSIAAVILLAFLTLVINTVKASRLYSTELTASLYLAEAIEAAKDLEESDWSEIESASCEAPTNCHPEISAGLWEISSGSEILENFYERKVNIEKVCRDSITYPNNIINCGEPLAIEDPGTKKVLAKVSWYSGYGDRILNLETYVYKQ